MTLEGFLRDTRNRRNDSSRGAVVYSEAERLFAQLFARKQLSKGISQSKISAQLGIGNSTLYGWLGSKKRKNAFKRVEVKSKPQDVTSFVGNDKVAIVSPRGFRLEGLSLKNAVTLLGELG